MAEDIADLLKKVMALPLEQRESLARALLVSLGETLGSSRNAWADNQRKNALAGLAKTGRVGYMEASFEIQGGLPQRSQSELLQGAERAAIHAFGWPIGIVLHNENRPRPMSDGIVAEISGPDFSYDYWALRTNGDFFFLANLFEDERAKDAIWFDIRIVRATETLLFCYRLYKALGAAEDTMVMLNLQHGGLRDRILGSAKPGLWAPNRICHEHRVEWRETTSLASLKTELPQLVKRALDPLFVLFDFFQPSDHQVYSAVNEFAAKVTQQQEPFEV